MSAQPSSPALTHRHRAILRPSMLATHELFRAGLIIAEPGPPGHRVAARVTDEGRLLSRLRQDAVGGT